MKPGEANAKGNYPKNTFNYLVTKNLKELSDALKEKPGKSRKKKTAFR